MPKPRRSSAARGDSRPAFNRPPNARPGPAVDDDNYTPRGTPKRTPKEKARNSPAASPHDYRRADRDRRKSSAPVRERDRRKISAPVRERDRAKYTSGSSADSGSHLLSSGALSKLNAYNENTEFREKYEAQKQKKKQKQYKNLKAEVEPVQRRRKKKNRNVSGAVLEEGRSKHPKRRGGGGYDEKEYREGRRSAGDRKIKKKWWILGSVVIILIVIIAVAVAVANKNKKKSGGGSSSSTQGGGSTTPTNTCSDENIPASAKGTILDVSTWMDTSDFNCTYTAETVGGLSVMGLNSDWDDTTRANSDVPSLDQEWEYGTVPIRGVNIGGWLSIEPFITPSLFDYPAADSVVDEYTLSAKLGAAAQRVIESHYSTFITKQSFQDIANAGLDHVRIPYPYWVVTTYPGDPYVPKVGWRYLLRAIEWARESGLRVNLDLHAVPGSQNGWTHSGRLGAIDWISGADGATNAQRSLDIHNQLSQFFAQERYKNVVTIYGLVNEPKMLVIPPQSVVSWNEQAVKIIRGNGLQQHVAFGDGFLALTEWHGMFQDVDSKLILDTHQYQIFNMGQLKLKHQDKINLACSGWTGIMVGSNNPSTGWGPTMDGEWSQADTDCAQYLNNVGVGSRWTGTYNMNDPTLNVLTPDCPTQPCSCESANADPSEYSDSYKQFLKMYAEAQMHSFEQAWGWFYWTWKTENAVQWSWMLGLQAGILPSNARKPDFDCSGAVPSFSDLSEGY